MNSTYEGTDDGSHGLSVAEDRKNLDLNLSSRVHIDSLLCPEDIVQCKTFFNPFTNVMSSERHFVDSNAGHMRLDVYSSPSSQTCVWKHREGPVSPILWPAAQRASSSLHW